MKTLRSLFALVVSFGFAALVASAEPVNAEKKSDKPAKAACGCETGKDGKVCGVDKDCCCTGGKAKGGAKKSEGCGDKPADGDKKSEKSAKDCGDSC